MFPRKDCQENRGSFFGIEAKECPKKYQANLFPIKSPQIAKRPLVLIPEEQRTFLIPNQQSGRLPLIHRSSKLKNNKYLHKTVSRFAIPKKRSCRLIPGFLNFECLYAIDRLNA